ncbi:MAG: hypothetical protein R2867_32875 [Caldilineaceae bacterium]
MVPLLKQSETIAHKRDSHRPVEEKASLASGEERNDGLSEWHRDKHPRWQIAKGKNRASDN